MRGGGLGMDVFEILALLLVIPIVLLLLAFRGMRSYKESMPYEGSTMAYFESIKNVDPEQGIDYIVDYIRNPKWGCPPKDLPDFLFAMAERTDGFGEAARKKISELGLLQNV